MSEPVCIQTYTPGDRQRAFHESAAKFRLLLGAWGSGKSMSLIWEDIIEALEYPKSFGAIYRKTYPALRDTTKKDYLAECPPELIADIRETEGREQIEFVNGSVTIFRCLDDPKKLGSTQFDRVKLDEAWEFSFEEFRTLGFGRLRGKIGPRRLAAASNPPNRDSWMHDFFVRDANESTAIFHLSTYDNKLHLPPDYIANLERMPESWKRKFLYGEWGVLVTGTPVFQNFNSALHIVKEPSIIPTVPLMRGWDFGFHHPACVVLQVAPTGHAIIHWEKLGRDQDLQSFCGEVLEEHARLFPYAKFEDYCDIAGAFANPQGLGVASPGAAKTGKDRNHSAVAVMRAEFGLFPRFRKLGIFQSIEHLRKLVGQLASGVPLLRLSKDGCPILIDAFAGGYVLDTDRTEKLGGDGRAPGVHQELPKKDGYYDHLMDCVRYILGRPIVAAGGGSAFAGRPLPRTWRLTA